MAQSPNPSFKKLTAIDIVNVSDLFKQHLTITENGAVYADGWDDDRVAREAIPNYTGNSRAAVGKYRITLGYGLLAVASKKSVSSEYEEILGHIYRTSGALGRRMNELEDRLKQLEKSHFAISSAESQLRRMHYD